MKATPAKKAYQAAYYAANREEIKAQQAAYYAAHREEAKAYQAAHKEEKRAYNVAYRAAHREEARAANAAYHAANREEIKAQRAAYRAANREKAKAYRVANSDKAKAARRMLDYGLSPEAFNLLRSEQKNACAICKEPFSKKPPNVDHCHKSGKIRGLLCRSCNALLGDARDSEEILESAKQYLKRTKI